MNRRDWFRRLGLAAGAMSLPAMGHTVPALAEQIDRVPRARGRKLTGIKITDVKSILTAPAGIRLVVVKVLTNQPGLYGLGCATFTQRARAVETAVNVYLRPFLLGKNPLQIEDIWQSSFVSSYWRNGPVLNNAMSGVDMALWDILGKETGMPVYQLFGGKCRHGVDTYRHASGKNFQEVEQAVRRFVSEGYRHIRIQVAVPGVATYGASGRKGDVNVPANRRTRVWEPAPYVRIVPRLFEHIRDKVGEDVWDTRPTCIWTWRFRISESRKRETSRRPSRTYFLGARISRTVITSPTTSRGSALISMKDLRPSFPSRTIRRSICAGETCAVATGRFRNRRISRWN